LSATYLQPDPSTGNPVRRVGETVGHNGYGTCDHALMDKDPSVNDIVQRLRSDLAQAFDVVDHWPDDPHAVGVARPSDNRFLVYFCTFPPQTETIAYEREGPSSDEDLPYSTDGMVESATYADLLAACRQHLAD
jgi:hypothetical protein